MKGEDANGRQQQKGRVEQGAKSEREAIVRHDVYC